MTSDVSSLSPDKWSLERQCDFISRLYWLWVGGMTVVTLFKHGEETVVQWRFTMLNTHQSGHFIDGLKKLGIDPDKEPAAVVAAKYHYFSNGLGGIDLEMVVESPKKAWIRYNGPYVPDGTGWLANPPSVGRAPFEGWHPYNGVRLNKPRLGFVLCRGFSDGEPYAEGYFLEYDHDLTKEERFRFDPSETMPPFDLETAPKLDPEVWPPDRIAKSKRNFGRGYVEVSILSLVQVLDAPTVVGIVEKSYRGIAIQYGRQLLEELGIKGSDAGALATFMKHLTDMAGDEAELTSPSPGKHILRTTRRRLFEVDKASAEIHRAMFGFVEMMAKIVGRGIRVSLTALKEEGSPYDEMVFEDVGG